MGDAGRPTTVSGLRERIAQRLTGHVADPQDEARELLAGLHDAPRSWSIQHAHDELIDLLIDAADDATDRRANGAPMPYAIGRAAFRHLFLFVDERVLIPRPETEELVSLALPFVTAGSTVVDVGTGSGAIALALARESRASRVIGTDVSSGAIDVAELNARATLTRDCARTEFRVGHLLEPVGEQHIDVVVSNPPYIAIGEREGLPDAVRAWEPALALFGGPDGMGVIRELVSQAEHRLTVGGMLLMEVDARRADDARACTAAPQWRDAQVVVDAFGRDRFVIAQRTAAAARAPGVS
ncbi:MAG: peptide chain release factor N(5)-glutamine methyltransferase [Gemmatimonadaceae bacterium]|nr:peptide chain release factor N(5)-glutamine methyltransferase [Gemmatimonadaceae bacterium]